MVRPNRPPLSGEVEIDESYLGGPEPGKSGRGAGGKAIVAAAVERSVARAVVGFGSRRLPTSRPMPSEPSSRSTSAATKPHTPRRARLCAARQDRLSAHRVLSKLDRTAAEVLPLRRGAMRGSSSVIGVARTGPGHPRATDYAVFLGGVAARFQG